MSIDLHAYRQSYEKSSLEEKDLADNPITQFQKWIQEAEDSGTVLEVNAMTLTTIDTSGFPRSRVVLLKQVDTNGFYFYTNYQSFKGQAIEKNNKVSLSFFWPDLERQINILGTATKLSEKESEAYFHSRPRGSQLGAIVSPQSSSIPNREYLENKLKEITEKYKEVERIPKPKHWGGYIVKPISVEFWQGRPNRLHDRVEYVQKGSQWIKQRLAP
ncbi:MAG TPA: pyridoxamine 5'-phosphate oxidase [Flavobacteriaceae bacterium]|nr:pyridoxamine 5'-phosphate oxidase [Flavobacteriaceae bacterium]